MAFFNCFFFFIINFIIFETSNRKIKQEVDLFFPLEKMDLHKSESSSEDNSKAAYSFPISENAKKLDLPIRDRYLQKISAIGIDPVLIEGKHFQPDCLPPLESTDILFYLVLKTRFYTHYLTSAATFFLIHRVFFSEFSDCLIFFMRFLVFEF